MAVWFYNHYLEVVLMFPAALLERGTTICGLGGGGGYSWQSPLFQLALFHWQSIFCWHHIFCNYFCLLGPSWSFASDAIIPNWMTYSNEFGGDFQSTLLLFTQSCSRLNHFWQALWFSKGGIWHEVVNWLLWQGLEFVKTSIQSGQLSQWKRA